MQLKMNGLKKMSEQKTNERINERIEIKQGDCLDLFKNLKDESCRSNYCRSSLQFR